MRPNKNYRCRGLLLVLPVFWMLGCSASSHLQSSLGNKYRYFVSLSAPRTSEPMLFRDDRMIIQFRLDDPAIRFQLQNISLSTMQLDWTHTSLAIGGTPLPVRNLATYYDTSSVPTMSPEIPSLGVIRDVVAPRSGISVSGKEWRSADLLPTTDGNSFARESVIKGMVGKTMELTLPVRFDREIKTYRFVFSIDSVRPILWSEYRTPAWLPPAPPVQGVGQGSEELVATAIIIGGFVGIVRYIMTMKKTPVTE